MAEKEYHIRLSIEDDAAMKKRAEATGLKTQDYFKSLIRAEDFNLYRIELITEDLNKHTALVYRLVKDIESLLITIKQSSSARPEDIEKIKLLISDIREENKKGYKINSRERIRLMQEIVEYLNTVRSK